MKLLKTLFILSIFCTCNISAEEVTGLLGFSNAAKGYYVFGIKGLDKMHHKKDPVCKSRYLIPDTEKDLIDLVKTPDNQTIKVTYRYVKIAGGGSRDHCIVESILLINATPVASKKPKASNTDQK